MKTILRNDLFHGNKIALFDDDIAPEKPKSTNAKKTTGNPSKNDHSNTGLYIAIAALILLIGFMIYQNLQENE